MAILSCIHKLKKSIKKLVKKALPFKHHNKQLPEDIKKAKQLEEVPEDEVSEVDENLANEALEARLHYLIESSPASLDFTLTGCILQATPEEGLQYGSFWISDDSEEESNSWNFNRESFISQQRSFSSRRRARLQTQELPSPAAVSTS